MPERVGVIATEEDDLPHALIAKINETPGFRAEFATFGARSVHDGTSTYRALVDRSAHLPVVFRQIKALALAGVYVVNDPWACMADDKFFGSSLAVRLGLHVPRTVLLPPRVVRSPRAPSGGPPAPDWDSITRYVGFPAVLKPADAAGGGFSIVRDMRELQWQYAASGPRTMTLQEYIEFNEYVRCICIGRELIVTVKHDPPLSRRDRQGRYYEHQGFLPRPLEAKVLDTAWAVMHALGYDLCSMELACQDGVPFVIDMTNPRPDLRRSAILPRNFDIIVEQLARFVVKAVREGRTNLSGYSFNRVIEERGTRS